MNENVSSLIRTVLTLLGTFLIGKSLFGATADSSTVEILIGAAMAISSVVWGLVTKTLGLEMWQSSIRQVITAVGGFLMAAGKLSSQQLELVVGSFVGLSQYIYAWLSRSKSKQLETGKITTDALKK